MTGRSFRGFHRSKCLEAGLVQGDKLSVDGSFVEANANKQAWLLKNSLAELPPKMRRVRMPYKRFSPISDTFLVTPFGLVFRQIEFFNSHG
jgi:hypothetical protein